MPADENEVFVPFRVPRGSVRVATEFRSTWLVASLGGLRQRGLLDRYAELLPPARREEILQTVAGAWLPVETALVHYHACDALGLTALEQVAIGRSVLDGLNKTVFSLASQAARAAGVSPWTVLKHFPLEFDRGWRGGGACGVFRLGPKDARVELIGFPLADIPYARAALRGMAAGLCEPACTKIYVRELPAPRTKTTCAFRLAWA